MSTPKDTRTALSDITNNHVTDNAKRKREERNAAQRKRRAEMSIEQREEINRKQREYRARKKAATQNITTSCVVSPTELTSSPIVGGSSSRDKLLRNRESYNNMDAQKKEDLLQRNWDYKMHRAMPGDNFPRLRHNHVQGETNEDEFDRELFEPTNIVEDGPDYESYRVLVEGAAAHSVTDDPYEFIYQNLPQKT
ncbi:unnamed protein product [Miscanthus lutarioriparius]|uniref:Uncharacterized protein n=1 Tax=Miscanthus lutarioriparius TaxID=422564 RepID=A0A811R6G2_9POAL|nr:unnamed protein product [Miscanthus lutarioriparius]